MEVITLEVRSESAMTILRAMEKADLVKVVQQTNSDTHPTRHLRGSISKETAADLQRQLQQAREEW